MSAPVHTRPALAHAEVVLAPVARLALRADGVFAIVYGSIGLFIGQTTAEWTRLPSWLLAGASVALVAYGIRAVQAGRAPSVLRDRAEGLVMFNAVWAVAAAALVLGGWVSPTVFGHILVAAHVAVPGAVAGIVLRSLRPTR